MSGEMHAAERLCAAVCGPSERSTVHSGHPEFIDRWLASTENELVAVKQLLDLPQWRLNDFALHPGSGGRQKCWPAERYLESIRAMRAQSELIPVVLLGEAEEHLQPIFNAEPGLRYRVLSDPFAKCSRFGAERSFISGTIPGFRASRRRARRRTAGLSLDRLPRCNGVSLGSRGQNRCWRAKAICAN